MGLLNTHILIFDAISFHHFKPTETILVMIKVEKHDVDEAFRLLRVAMQQSATDHATGSFFTVTFKPIILS